MAQKKVALYTIQSVNYGNRLQNYAAQEFLTSMGCDVFSLRNSARGSQTEVLLQLHPWLRAVKPVVPIVHDLKIRICGMLCLDKDDNYRRFDRLIRFTDDYLGPDGFSASVTEYDAVIAGSDQIWNTEFEFVSLYSFFPFAHPCKIAFSSSFGVDQITRNDEIVKCLKDFKAISVREDAGAAIVWELADRKAEVLVDPTMLISPDQWRKIARKPKGMEDKPYVLTYFLSAKCEKANCRLEKLKKQLCVYELFDTGNAVTRCAGPAEFLYLIDHASIVLTDSFHACVFSFLFGKPFIVYDRNRGGSTMNSRLTTLLKKFDLERKYEGSGLDNDIWEHDYSTGYTHLNLEKEKALNFLKSALGDTD